jgi:hypothetical protein
VFGGTPFHIVVRLLSQRVLFLLRLLPELFLLRLPPLLFVLRLEPVLFRLEPDLLRAPPLRLRLPAVLFLLLPPLPFSASALALRRRVAAPFRAAAERDALDREAAPLRPPLRDELLLLFLPRPDPLFLPPPSSLFTVAQARRSASRRETPRFS